MAVDRVAVRGVFLCSSGFVMSNDLVAEEIEVDPVFGASPFGKTENSPVKVTCFFEIIDRKGDVKGANRGGGGERHTVMVPICREVRA